MIAQYGGVRDPGTYQLDFTHCVKAELETRVGDGAWPASWSDEFIDYDRWLAAGSPEGYVWGTNWSLAFPGLVAVRDSPEADDWTQRLGQQMHELTLETDRFHLRLIFHSIRSRKLNDDQRTVSSVIIPLPPRDA